MATPILQDFEQRDLVANITAAAEFAAHLAEASRTIYVGFDPTADSLHIGNLVPLLGLRRFQLAGHRPIVLVGGGTGLIGDPAGKAGERALSPQDQVAAAAARLKAQVQPFLDFDRGAHAALLVDNYEWLSKLEVIPFLRDTGKHFGVGAMVAREAVRTRLGSGISFTEFSYQVLQAYDFLALHERYGCTAQMGGSDQWGNITAGTELIRKVRGVTAYGLTLPLVAKADGTKFGKTESGTVWLDPGRTSAYEMYQFWLNTSDADVVRFLKIFTFLPIEEIGALGRRVVEAPEKREAQRVLAHEVTRLVHGEAAAAQAERISGALFSGDVGSLSDGEREAALRTIPSTCVGGTNGVVFITEALLATGLASSKRAARELIASGAIQVDGERVRDEQRQISGKALIRKGKTTYVGVEVTR
jgi:tyrosyl-tRNA synthetase